MHKVRRRRQMAVVRELWTARDRIAQRRDVSPGKVLSDAAIVEAALALPANVAALSALPGFGHRMGRRQLEQWQAAVDRARALPENELPQPGQQVTGPPPPRAWADKDPVAAARLSAARTAVSALAEELNLPQENLITPDTVRRVCWEPPAPATEETVAAALTAHGARPWQVGLVTPLLVTALAATA
jgi:ribonuclease D